MQLAWILTSGHLNLPHHIWFHSSPLSCIYIFIHQKSFPRIQASFHKLWPVVNIIHSKNGIPSWWNYQGILATKGVIKGLVYLIVSRIMQRAISCYDWCTNNLDYSYIYLSNQGDSQRPPRMQTPIILKCYWSWLFLIYLHKYAPPPLNYRVILCIEVYWLNGYCQFWFFS